MSLPIISCVKGPSDRKPEMDTLPEISLGTAALVIFVCCAGYMIIRGLARTIVNTALIVVSAWIGFRVWQEAPSLAINWFGDPSELIVTGLPVLAFLATFILLRKLVGFFRAPIPRPIEEVAPRTSGQLFFRLAVTIIPAALLCLVAATLIHHAGSIAEIRDSVVTGGDSPPIPGLAERLKNSLVVAIPQSLMDKLDPLASQQRVKLAKMIAASRDKPLEPVIDPETGQPYPRAIIVDDPKLVGLAREGRFSTLLRHPLLSDALNDPAIKRTLGLE